MKLQQLRYAVETFRCNLNVSEAAERLFTSQPGVSKQIRLLEEELGVPIFIRNGKRIVAVTPVGRAVLETAERILQDVQHIKHMKHRFLDSNQGSLNLAITSTLARLRLPESMACFLQKYPDVQVNITQASPDEIATMVLHGKADVAITCQTPKSHELHRLVCEPWHYAVLLPQKHDLLAHDAINLAQIAAYPLLTYDYMLKSDAPLGRALMREGVKNWRVALAANDVDVLQRYVKMGLGVGVVDAALVHELDEDLVLLDVSHLLTPEYVQILLRPDYLVRNYSYDFFECFCADLTRERVDRVLYAPPVDDFSI